MRIAAFIAVLFIAGAAKAHETYFITASTVLSYSVTAVTAPHPGVGSQTRRVRLVCTSDCFVAISHAFTTLATSSPTYLPLDKPEVFRIEPGNTILVIKDTADGDLHISELSK
ncbi:hypothetical protein LCGC14_1504140 [marine sediment metagenome]|uniref:Uncharacterized protein n=1 Tax=marine sediment metagenome TaxID=412755 RepID=A0A0F9J385_9ZZZZ